MNCILIGGAGFIGTRTALRLQAHGHTVKILDSFDPQIHGADILASEMFNHVAGKIPVSVGDVRDPSTVKRALDDIDVVFYMASCTGTGQSMYQVRKYTDINVQGAAVLGEELAQRRGQISRVVISSSRAVYGEGAYSCEKHGRVYPSTRKLIDLEVGRFNPVCPRCGGDLIEVASEEADPVSPSSIYGISKFAQEQVILNLCEAVDIPAVSLRYQNVYGPGQSLKNPYTGILSIFSQLLLQGKPINLFEDGRPTRDFIYIDDIVEYNCRAAEHDLVGCHVCNVGTGQRQSLAEVVRALEAAFQRKADFKVSGQFRIGDIRHAVADIGLLQCTFGSHSFVPFSVGTQRFASWVLKQTLEGGDGGYKNSLVEMASKGLLRGGRGTA